MNKQVKQVFKTQLYVRFGRIAVAVSLVIGMLAFGAANSWAGNGGESVGFRNFTLYKFCSGDVTDWDQKMKGNGMVDYTCDADGCQVVVDAIGICSANQDIRYCCDDGAVLHLLSNGVLLVPDECEGTCQSNGCTPACGG